MRIPNEPDGPSGAPFDQWVQLQADFQARLAEETLKYLRRLQHAASPSAPGTVVVPGEHAELRATASAGQRVRLTLEVENRQRVHCVVSPALTPLVATSGTTWFPAAEPSPPLALLASGAVEELSVDLAVPDKLTAGTYRGLLLLQGFSDSGVPVAVEVTGPVSPEAIPEASPEEA